MNIINLEREMKQTTLNFGIKNAKKPEKRKLEEAKEESKNTDKRAKNDADIKAETIMVQLPQKDKAVHEVLAADPTSESHTELIPENANKKPSNSTESQVELAEDVSTALVKENTSSEKIDVKNPPTVVVMKPTEEEKKVNPKSVEEKKKGAVPAIPRPQKIAIHKFSDRMYHPVNDAPFYYGENVPFSFLVQSLQEIEKCKGENSKDMIKEIVSNVFRSISLLHSSELASAFYFYIVKLAPEYKNKETGTFNKT